MKFTPHYQGNFEVFRDEEGNQYARMEYTDKCAGSYEWFKFDFWKESYVLETYLSKEWEKSYQSLKEGNINVSCELEDN